MEVISVHYCKPKYNCDITLNEYGLPTTPCHYIKMDEHYDEKGHFSRGGTYIIDPSTEEMKSFTLYELTDEQLIALYKHNRTDVFPYFFKRIKNVPDDREFLCRVVDHYGSSLEHLPEKYKDDIELVKIAIGPYWQGALKFASHRIRSTESIIRELTLVNPNAFENATDDLRDNYQLCRFAIQKNHFMYKYASSRLRQHKSILLLAFKHEFIYENSKMIPHVNMERGLITLETKHLLNDLEFVYKLLKRMYKYFNLQKGLFEFYIGPTLKEQMIAYATTHKLIHKSVDEQIIVLQHMYENN